MVEDHMEKNKPVVELREVSKVYGQYEAEVRAIDGVSCSIYPGELVAVTGPSGCGKSTLLSLMGLLDRPSSGKVLVDGVDTSAITDREAASFRGRKMGFVFQLYNVIPRFTALENVMLPGIIQDIPADRLSRRALELLRDVGIAHRADHKGAHLSGGEQQKIAIARALINDPSIILADEPTGALDSENSRLIMEILKKMNEVRRVTTLFVTHDPDLALYARRIIELRDGKIANDRKNGEEVI